jgi:type IV pilus assembly protein PilE
MKNAVRGFTLIEVMVVVVIVAILASIAYPSYLESVRKTKRAEARAALMRLMQQQERYYSQHTTYMPFSSASTDAEAKKFDWFSGESAAASFYEINAAACDGEDIRNCVVLTATPGTANVNSSYQDPVCGELKLTSTGEKSAAAGTCW